MTPPTPKDLRVRAAIIVCVILLVFGSAGLIWTMCNTPAPEIKPRWRHKMHCEQVYQQCVEKGPQHHVK